MERKKINVLGMTEKRYKGSAEVKDGDYVVIVILEA